MPRQPILTAPILTDAGLRPGQTTKRVMMTPTRPWRWSNMAGTREKNRLTNEINDEKIVDRLDNAVLDGSDVDTYLRDRVRRRDIFMSMTMNMI
ncbi:hypothetical protein AUP68_14139 [Ilyonectria robusta]